MSLVRSNKRREQPVLKSPSSLRLGRHIWVVVLGLLLFTMLSVAGLRALNQSLAVESWEIDASPLVQTHVNHALEQMESLDFLNSRPSLLRQKLLKEVPDLADVYIQRQLPNALSIHVVLRQAVALWQNDAGVLYLVDDKGEAYRPRVQGESIDLPVLRMPQKKLHAAIILLLALKKKSPEWFANSSEILAEDAGWRLNFSKGQQWLLPFGEKAVHNTALLSRIVQNVPWNTKVWRVDTRWGNRWFFRPARHEGVV